MAEAKKRFPWRLLACAVPLVPLAAVVVLVETAGRQGTLEGRWEGLREREEISEVDLLRIVGSPLRITPTPIPGAETAQTYVWEDRPAMLAAMVYPSSARPETRTATIMLKFVDTDARPGFTWHFRRRAEQAYTAIHGPRR
jgi:hypothetical protein